MFWSGNYIAVRELKFLLKEANVSLTQVLEADDILQECKADNNALIQYLTKPHILAELIALITEEPSKNVELSNQYRHANIACEVLTSHLSTLSDRLSMDGVQMNRLCDFINREPPLNPLLASFFSKTIEMLLIRNPKQDWYLYHIVCLRVLDFFKSRRDFLPNLLRHISTSAIADIFKYFIRLDDIFNKIVMEWLEEHQFLESLIQIISGTFVPEELPQLDAQKLQQQPENFLEQHEEYEDDHRDDDDDDVMNRNQVDANGNNYIPPVDAEVDNAGVAQARAQAAAEAEAENEELRRRRQARMEAVASGNAVALLCELVATGCAPEGCSGRSRGSWSLVSRLRSAEGVGALLQGMFTSPPHARVYALVHGCTLLRTLLMHNTQPTEGGEEEDSCVELAVGPHLPLLHHALLHDPDAYMEQDGRGEGARRAGRVGAARVQVAALLAQLALCPIEEVSSTMLTLGTPGILVDMFFSYPNNNFLHGEVHALLKHSLLNGAFRTQYARHLLIECDMLTRLMDVFEENEDKTDGEPRSGYMGHVVLMLKKLSKALEPSEGDLAHQLLLNPALLERWNYFVERKLQPLLEQHATPLGGYYPPSNIYDVEDMSTIEIATLDGLPDINTDDINDMTAQNSFMEMADARFNDNMWDDAPETEPEDKETPETGPTAKTLLEGASPWDNPFPDGEVLPEGAGSGEGWAQFMSEAFSQAAIDPFAPVSVSSPQCNASPASQTDTSAVFGADEFTPFWSYGDTNMSNTDDNISMLESSMHRLDLESEDARSVKLANNLLTAMSGMSPDDIADIVSATATLHPHLPCAPPAHDDTIVSNTGDNVPVTGDSGVTIPQTIVTVPPAGVDIPYAIDTVQPSGDAIPQVSATVPQTDDNIPQASASTPPNAAKAQDDESPAER